MDLRSPSAWERSSRSLHGTMFSYLPSSTGPVLPSSHRMFPTVLDALPFPRTLRSFSVLVVSLPSPFPSSGFPIVSERRFGGWGWATPWDLSHVHGHFHPLFLGWSIPIPSMRNKCNGLAWPPPPPPATIRGGSKRQGRRERVPGDAFTCTRTCWCRSCALLRLHLPVASSTSWPREACHSSAGLADASPTFPSTPGGLGASTRA